MANRFELMTNTHDHFKFVIRDLENENDDNEIAWMQTEKDAALIHRALACYVSYLEGIVKRIKTLWDNGDCSVIEAWRQETTSLTPEEKEKIWRKLFPDAAQ